jgi:hypothetical protein
MTPAAVRARAAVKRFLDRDPDERARLSPGGRPSPKGRASIDVYALQRPRLVRTREAMQIRVQPIEPAIREPTP